MRHTSNVTPYVRGSDAMLMSKPWMVYLHTSKNQFICGGSLINPWFILTAAHCFADKYNYIRIFARLREHNSKSPIDCNYNECAPLPREYLVIQRIRHPFYTNPRNYDNALGRLSNEVIYTDSISHVDRYRWEISWKSVINT